MVLVDIDSETAEAIAADVERDLHALERLMSRFDGESPVSDLNRRAGENAVYPPQALWEILLLCRDYWKRTRGAFDITLQPLNRLWREHSGREELPTEPAIEQARQLAGFGRLQLDETNRTVRFERAGMSVDLGGFGKGYALECVASSLRSQGVQQAFLSFGESSIAVVGAHPHGPAWPVGITDMFRPSETVHTFHLRDASLSTSGTTPYNCMGGARAFGQIVDPRSGLPIEGYRTMSVAGPGGLEAEVLSTALLVTPERDRATMLSGFSSVSAVEIIYDSSAGKYVPRIEWKYGL